MRKGWSVLLLVTSLVAVIVQMFYTMIVAGGLEVMGPEGVIILAVFLTWFSRSAKGKGWFVNNAVPD